MIGLEFFKFVQVMMIVFLSFSSVDRGEFYRVFDGAVDFLCDL